MRTGRATGASSRLPRISSDEGRLDRASRTLAFANGDIGPNASGHSTFGHSRDPDPAPLARNLSLSTVDSDHLFECLFSGLHAAGSTTMMGRPNRSLGTTLEANRESARSSSQAAARQPWTSSDRLADFGARRTGRPNRTSSRRTGWSRMVIADGRRIPLLGGCS